MFESIFIFISGNFCWTESHFSRYISIYHTETGRNTAVLFVLGLMKDYLHYAKAAYGLLHKLFYLPGPFFQAVY